MKINTKMIAIVNASTTLNRRFNTELSSYTVMNEQWQHFTDCQYTLDKCRDELPGVWILCADDHSEEILDFIPLIQERCYQTILVIDSRRIMMPAMWIAYFKAGVSGCIVDKVPSQIANTLSFLQQAHGILQLPHNPLQLLQ